MDAAVFQHHGFQIQVGERLAAFGDPLLVGLGLEQGQLFDVERRGGRFPPQVDISTYQSDSIESQSLGEKITGLDINVGTVNRQERVASRIGQNHLVEIQAGTLQAERQGIELDKEPLLPDSAVQPFLQGPALEAAVGQHQEDDTQQCHHNKRPKPAFLSQINCTFVRLFEQAEKPTNVRIK